MLQGLFHAAGEIRALQLNIQLILETENVPAQVIDEYKDAEKMLIKVFIKNIPYFLESLKIFTQSIALPENFPEKNIINAYFEKIYKQANNLLKQPNRIKMHLFRKKIKALMYFHNALPQQSIRHIKFNSTSIDQLQESAGKWHDLYNAFIFFRFSNYATLLTENITELKRREKKSYAALSKTLRFKAD